MVIYESEAVMEHCAFCNYCMRDLDHHCPWSSKCIARGNMVQFQIFIGSLMICMIYVFASLTFAFGMED
jgi:hypothetical protein